MPKFKNLVANATPLATLLLGDRIKEEIRALNEKPLSTITPSSNTREQPFLHRRGGEGGRGWGAEGGGLGCKPLQ